MEAHEPRWHLTRPCPTCGQGSSLLFVVCPRCQHVAVACIEEGSFFPDPGALASVRSDGSTEVCPRCHAVRTADFEPATDLQVLGAGFRHGEYR